MKLLATTAVALALALSPAAHAAVVVTSEAGTDPYSGPTPLYDFETPVPILSGGSIVTGTQGSNGPHPWHTQPYGSTGYYLSAGIDDGSPAIFDLSAIDRVSEISFLWGSIDQFNTFSLRDALDNVLFSINGTQLRALNPMPFGVGDLNRFVTFTITDLPTQLAITQARLDSTRDAFEIDNFGVVGVPEPATWLMMLLGFGAIGFTLRRKPNQPKVRVRFV